MALVQVLCALSISSSISLVHGFVDFGTVTMAPIHLPTLAIPRPYQLPSDVYMRYATFESSITAIAPSLSYQHDGGFATHYSLHYHSMAPKPTDKRQQTLVRNLAKRGVFGGQTVPTCTPCGYGTATGTMKFSRNGTGPYSTCSDVQYSGVFRSGDYANVANTATYCFFPGYTGPLDGFQRLSSTPMTTTGLPCCPTCSGTTRMVNMTNTFTATTGVFQSPSSMTSHTLIRSSSPRATATVTAPIITRTRSTISVVTIAPTITDVGSPVLLTAPATLSGCGIASNGCGTVVGSGTVYLVPSGFPSISSSGTVSGCAQRVKGCGIMYASTGTFTVTGPSAVISACGEGTGVAALSGSGTVWPNALGGYISFVSSGIITGTGRVKGCGVLTGSGTFTITAPYTYTSTPTTTVNVYVSYCPPAGRTDIGGLAALFGSNYSSPARVDTGLPDSDIQMDMVDANGEDSGSGQGYKPGFNIAPGAGASLFNNGNPLGTGDSSSKPPKYIVDAQLYLNNTVPTYNNNTNNSTVYKNVLDSICHICPQDSGMCCPPYTDCGSDGHCPWQALVGAGYVKHGLNVVAVANSSSDLGSGSVGNGTTNDPRLMAPGLPGSKQAVGDGMTSVEGPGITAVAKKRYAVAHLHSHAGKHSGYD